MDPDRTHAHDPQADELAFQINRGQLPDAATLSRMLSHADPRMRALAHRAFAVAAFRVGQTSQALQAMARAAGEGDFSALGEMGFLSDRAGSWRALSDALARAADALAQAGSWSQAVQAAQWALVTDGRDDFSLSTHRPRLDALARVYEQAARACLPPPPPPAPPHGGENRPLRIAHVANGFVDHFIVATRQIECLLRRHDRARFEPAAFSSEDHSRRQVNDFYFYMAAPGSLERGPEFLRAAEKLGVPTWLAPTDRPHLAAALELARRIRAGEIDAAVYHGSLANPVMCLCALLRPAPLQINFVTGVPMYVPGIQACVYSIEDNFNRDLPYWRARGVETACFPYGHIEEDSQPAQPRETWGVPARAPLLVTASNHVDERFSPAFLDAVARILAENPEAHYLVLGKTSGTRAADFFAERGVSDRVHWAGGHPRVTAALRAADAYLNEFPVGGVGSVIEAISAGLPGVAMFYDSVQQAQCGGARILGPDLSAARSDTDAYVRIATRLIRDLEWRARQGEKLKKLWSDRYSPASTTRNLEGFISSLVAPSC